jgi:hypothetical protein
MRQDSSFIGVSVLLGLLAAGLVLVFTTSFALPQVSMEPSDQSSPDTVIVARRIISIPFGIADSVVMQNDGQVLVSGHGICGAGGEWYRIKVDISQEGVSAPAVGHTEALCQGDDPSSWQALASLPGPHSFQQGTGRACALAVIHYEREGAITYQWCKDVMIE